MKKGLEYTKVVQELMKVLHPDKTIKINSIINGPDGKREIDVEVRGVFNNKDSFLFIECKDWNRPVGIEIIDAVDSKGQDLKTDEIIVFSNSGFTKEAINKSLRKNIKICSVLKNKDKIIKIKIYRKALIKTISIENWELIVYPVEEDLNKIPKDWNPVEDITYEGSSIIKWISKESKIILREKIKEFSFNKEINLLATYCFYNPNIFLIKNKPIILKGLAIKMHIIKKNFLCSIPVDASLGLYNYLSNDVVVPNKETYFEGPITFDNCEELKDSCEFNNLSNSDIENGHFQIDYCLYNYIRPISDGKCVNLDSIINREEAGLKICDWKN